MVYVLFNLEKFIQTLYFSIHLYDEYLSDYYISSRFCSISTSFVRRTLDGKLGASPAQPINGMGAPVKSKFNSIVKEQPIQCPLKGQEGKLSTKNGMQSTTVMSEKSDKIAPEVIDKGSKPSVVKESGIAVHINKTKGQGEKALSGSSGSLANLWGRASAKSKYTGAAIEITNDVPDTAGTCMIYSFSFLHCVCLTSFSFMQHGGLYCAPHVYKKNYLTWAC